VAASSIAGSVFSDTNANGTLNTGEHGLSAREGLHRRQQERLARFERKPP